MSRLDLGNHSLGEVVVHTAEVLRSGGVVLYPTDTVYGLGCDATRHDAVLRIRTLKHRSDTIPFIVLFADEESLAPWVRSMSSMAADVVRTCIPGPVTFILHSSERAMRLIEGCGETLAVRIPDHRFCVAVCAAMDAPLLSTSANLHGSSTPHAIDDIPEEILSCVDLLVDGGTLRGLPSTIVDLTGDAPRIVREGTVTRETLQQKLAPQIVLW